MLLATVGNMISQIDFEHFALNKSLFWPTNGLHKSRVCHFCLPLSLHCSFGSLFVRSMPPSKSSFWLQSRALFASKAALQKLPYASHLHFFEFRVPSAAFFAFLSLIAPSSLYFCSFFEHVLPALGGKHDFESCMHTKPWTKALLRLEFDRTSAFFGVLIAPQNL